MKNDFEVFLALSDGEGASGGRFPIVELVIVVLGDGLNFVVHLEGRVATHIELINQDNVYFCLKGCGML